MEAVLHVRAFHDNYIWIIPGAGREVAVVDPGDAAPVREFLERENRILAAVLCTHHHPDHVGGAQALRDAYGVPVYGPANETIAAVTHAVRDGDVVALSVLGRRFDVLEIPGHTRGHIAYFGHGLLFCGDTLFSAGCGRLFEGTAEQMHRSLSRLAALPEDTAVYCGHEYTASNLRFALAVEPNNTETLAYAREAQALLAAGRPTLPSTIGRERRINPFLRASDPRVKNAAERHVGERLENDVAVFAALRRWKDGYRG
ncbi:MAG TPA: hydroxyacylglutathione hydrolase [Burkholderiales bacterium]